MSTPGEFEHLGDRSVHRGKVWEVVVGQFRSPNGDAFERDIVRSPGAVGVVPITVDGDVVLVNQYRPAHARSVLEIPAGMRDVDGEDLATTAARELAEEVGLQAASMELLASTLPAVGMTDQVTTIFLATGCEPISRSPIGPEEEHAEILSVPLAHAIGWVESGQITDGKSMIGLLLAARRLPQPT